jgi:hypothetical protein
MAMLRKGFSTRPTRAAAIRIQVVEFIDAWMGSRPREDAVPVSRSITSTRSNAIASLGFP